MWSLQLNPALLALLSQSHSAAASSSEHACRGNAAAGDSVRLVQPAVIYMWGVQQVLDVPRYPCLVQHLADTMNSDADSECMLVLALSLAGRSAVEVEVVDAGRLQTWLGMSAPGDGPGC
jgi:hypothetical protein